MERKKNEVESLFETILDEHFPKRMKDINLQTEKALTLNRIRQIHQNKIAGK